MAPETVNAIAPVATSEPEALIATLPKPAGLSAALPLAVFPPRTASPVAVSVSVLPALTVPRDSTVALAVALPPLEPLQQA
jgi:hypothetical protein